MRKSTLQILLMALALTTLIGMAYGADMNFWKVVYTESSTEGGSSGSALLNDELQITGQLTGGNASCSSVNNPYYYDVFGKFSASWDLGISDYLGDAKKSAQVKSVPALKSPMAIHKAPGPITAPGLSLKAPFNPVNALVISDARITEARRDFDDQDAASGKRKVVGAHMEIPGFSSLTWEKITDASGNQSWRTAVKAPGAKALRLHFIKFKPGEDDTVIVYDGAFTAKSAHRVKPTRTATTDDFWGPITMGEVVFLEVVTESSEAPEIVVDKISYAFKDLFGGDDFLKVGGCYEDPNCYTGWEVARQGVGQMTFEYGDGMAVCTGSLIRDIEGSYEPFFFSARHCFHDQEAADSLIVTFFWYTNGCGGAVDQWQDVTTYTQGSEILAYSSQTDFLLLRLDVDNQHPLPDGAVFLGWDANENYELNDTISVLHHPAGTHMRLSFGYISGESDGSEVDLGDDDDDYTGDDDDDYAPYRDSGDDDDDECGIFCGGLV